MATTPPVSEIANSLRVAFATVLCLVLVAWLDLEHANLAVWTTFMVMVQFQFSAFQKGVERILGRGLGILLALVILVVCRNAWILALVLEALGLLTFFYVYFTGQLAYTFLNAGLYLSAVLEIGRNEPSTVLAEAEELFLSIVIGVVVADVVIWLTSTERTFAIKPGGTALFPLQPTAISRSLMLIVTLVLTVITANFLKMPTSSTLISVMMLTVTPNLQALLLKGELRLVGAVLGASWGLLTFALVNRAPHFPIMAAMVFLGIFMATYLARTAGDYAYAGVQMGLVLPLVVVVPLREFGDVDSAMYRLEGVIIALAASLLVGGVWTRLEKWLIVPQPGSSS
jgi:uncharacterized membrane protein YccC